MLIFFDYEEREKKVKKKKKKFSWVFPCGFPNFGIKKAGKSK